MSEVNQMVPRGRKTRPWFSISVAEDYCLSAGCGRRGDRGGWILVFSGAAAAATRAGARRRAPFYLELKPFVVSIASSTGAPRFLQMGLDLALSWKGAGNTVTAVLPEIQDALRQTALGFNAEEILTPAGVDRLRQAMIISANRLLMQRLGAAELKSLTGKSNGGVVQNILFSTLIVE